MRRFLAIFTLAVLLAGAAGFAAVYALSEHRLHVDATPPAFVADIPADAPAIRRGRHIARTRGCFGCHGQQLQGRVFTEEWPWVKRAVAPALAGFARSHTVAELEAVIRHGIDPDGRALWSMPSYNWARLSDADLVALIAFLRSQPPMETELPVPALGMKARWAVMAGARHMADLAEAVPALRLRDHPDERLRRGEYLAMTMCNECHGLDLRGASSPEGAAPDLAILAAYGGADFRELMKSGTAIGGRDNLPLMSMIARDRFAYLDERELEDLLIYLRTLPAQPVEQNVFWRDQAE